MANIYDAFAPEALLAPNTYPGRGIIIGKSEDGKSAVIAYFIMGRSENSRNRVFTEKEGSVYTEPHDYSKVSDPSLIIYSAIRKFENKLIVTNGDQTDTIYDFVSRREDMRAALRTREFEPDAPNFTPRISGVIDFADGDFGVLHQSLRRLFQLTPRMITFPGHDGPGITGRDSVGD